MKHFLIFGSHPELSDAEATAVLGEQASDIAGQAMGIYDTTDWDGAQIQNRLGGIIKLGDVLFKANVANMTMKSLAEFTLSQHQAGKILFGFTVYGGTQTQRMRIEKLALPFKRLLQEGGFPVRWVTGKEGSLSPAAVDKLNLTQEGYDFVFGIVDNDVYIGRTTHVQDATAWSNRDYGRPFRDARTGMLPPKLARMMVNLACETQPLQDLTLLDPFCGGGTVLMEAGLMGVRYCIGSDIDARQVGGSEQNLDWLIAEGLLDAEAKKEMRHFVSPAQTIDEHVSPASVDVIVTEGYLGHPLQGNEPQSFLNRQKKEVEDLWEDTLRTCAKLQAPGKRIVCIWPSYVTEQAVTEIDITDRLSHLGYKKVNHTPLIYGRAEQHVKRQVVILERV